MRMDGEERKKLIREAAKKVFLEKGFRNTVMEDIMQATGLSRGGLYHHYASTVDMLYGLMKDGIEYRAEKIKEFMKNENLESLDNEALAHILVDKMLDSNELMSLYVMYLLAAKHNKKLQAMFPKLVQETMTTNGDTLKGKENTFEAFKSKFIIFFMNTIMVGCEELGARENFKANRELFVEFVKIYLDFYEKNKIYEAANWQLV